MDHTNPTEKGRRQETSMNHSIYSADRTTHLKIVVVALVAFLGTSAFARFVEGRRR